MSKARGFKVKGKLLKIYKWVSRPRRKQPRYQSLDPPKRRSPMAKVLTLARSLRKGAKELCSPKSGYYQLAHDPVESSKQGEGRGGGIPKGHLAVYVGESQNETQRYLVPVIYFNHPLFGELLKEAEKVYGFNHPGRITIPCRASEFEKVQMRIASCGEHCKRHRIRHASSWCLSN